MEISQKEVDGITCIAMNGRLDGQSASDAEAVVDEILKSGKQRLLFDFSDLQYISSVGLRVVLTAVKELRLKGGKVILCCLSDHVKEVFVVSGFAAIIPISDTLETGILELS